jgi:hypothetical protein
LVFVVHAAGQGQSAQLLRYAVEFFFVATGYCYPSSFGQKGFGHGFSQSGTASGY